MTRQTWPVHFAVAGFLAGGFACLATLGSQLAMQAHSQPGPTMLQGGAPTAEAAPAAPDLRTATGEAALQPREAAAAPSSAAVSPEDSYYKQLRSRVRWVQTRVGNDRLFTPDLDSRLMLAKSAARRAGLSALGLGFEDVYGIINAETSWVPRMGASKDGTPNLGIAQFEPATAKALGVRDPDDAVEAVHAAALHMKEAALWSADRIAGLKLAGHERASKLREGISIYYNLSTRGRNTWNGRNTRTLPRETQLHIENARIGAQQAEFFDAQLQALKLPRGRGPAVVTAGRGAATH